MAAGESRREVRNAWIVFTVVFAGIGSIVLYKGGGSYPYWYGAAAFFAFFAAAAPMALLPLYRAWMKLAAALAWFNTRLLLGLVFFLVMTPMGVAMRAIGKDPLDRKIDRSAASYWKKRERQDDVSRYEKQY